MCTHLALLQQDQFKFGSLWPPLAVIIVIIMVYSVIQPIITSVGLLVGILLYVAYKFVFGWCADQPDEVSLYVGRSRIDSD
jgi:hypothetical protein